MSFSTPEDFFMPGDKEPIKNQLNLDWLTVGMLLLGVQEPHRMELTNVVKKLTTVSCRPFIPGCPIPTVPGYPAVLAVPNPGTKIHFVLGFGPKSN